MRKRGCEKEGVVSTSSMVECQPLPHDRAARDKCGVVATEGEGVMLRGESRCRHLSHINLLDSYGTRNDSWDVIRLARYEFGGVYVVSQIKPRIGLGMDLTSYPRGVGSGRGVSPKWIGRVSQNLTCRWAAGLIT